MHDMDPEERKWYLVARLLTDALTTHEQKEWETAILDEKFRKDFEKISKHWSTLETSTYLQINKDEDWKVVLGKIRAEQMPETRFTLSRMMKYAAAIAAMVVLVVAAWKFGLQSDRPTVATSIEAPKGARTSVILPDSSQVWLNAGSRISFDQHFGKDNRNVILEGEAFFDVEKDKIPFQIHTQDYNIAVLGTAFNVKAYADDDMVSTTLIRGSLKVNRTKENGEKEEILLHPNERVVLKGNRSERNRESIVLEKNIDGAAEADWKDGWLTVRGESLAELSKKIERLYNVKIQFEEEDVKNYHYTGRIQQFSLEQVMNALALTSPVRFMIHEKNVVLSIDESAKAKYNKTQKP